MTLCTLVVGADGTRRGAAIAARLEPGVTTAVILEGMHPGVAVLDTPPHDACLKVVNIAAGCPCCGDGRVMRVTLNRMLQRRPSQLFISLADRNHLSHLEQFLCAPPYAALLSLAAVVSLDG